MPCEIFWIIHLYVFYFIYDVIRCIQTTKNITMIFFFLKSMRYCRGGSCFKPNPPHLDVNQGCPRVTHC